MDKYDRQIDEHGFYNLCSPPSKMYTFSFLDDLQWHMAPEPVTVSIAMKHLMTEYKGQVNPTTIKQFIDEWLAQVECGH